MLIRSCAVSDNRLVFRKFWKLLFEFVHRDANCFRQPHVRLRPLLQVACVDDCEVLSCFHCASLAQTLRQRGYANVWALQGGLDAWRNAGLPLDSKPTAA